LNITFKMCLKIPELEKLVSLVISEHDTTTTARSVPTDNIQPQSQDLQERENPRSENQNQCDMNTNISQTMSFPFGNFCPGNSCVRNLSPISSEQYRCTPCPCVSTSQLTDAIKNLHIVPLDIDFKVGVSCS